MANLSSGVSCEGKAKAGGTTDEGIETEGSKEEERGKHDRLKAFIACGGEPVEPGLEGERTGGAVGV